MRRLLRWRWFVWLQFRHALLLPHTTTLEILRGGWRSACTVVSAGLHPAVNCPLTDICVRFIETERFVLIFLVGLGLLVAGRQLYCVFMHSSTAERQTLDALGYNAQSPYVRTKFAHLSDQQSLCNKTCQRFQGKVQHVFVRDGAHGLSRASYD